MMKWRTASDDGSAARPVRSCHLVLLWLMIAAVVGEANAQESSDADSSTTSEPTPLESLAREAQDAASQAAASASDARAGANEVKARLDAEASDDAAKVAEAAAISTMNARYLIQGALTESQRQQASAAQAAADAKAAISAGTLGVEQAAAAAAVNVSRSIEEKLAPVYKGLQEWKMKVLHDPAKEAAIAGMNAAKPYEDKLRLIERHAGEYEQRAVSLSNQARALRTGAVGLANAAQSKQASGALTAAQQDMMNAHQMMGQATAFETQGLRLMDDAKLINAQIPVYAKAAQLASQKASHKYAKHIYAPAPFAPFAMPPVFLERGITPKVSQSERSRMSERALRGGSSGNPSQ